MTKILLSLMMLLSLALTACTPSAQPTSAPTPVTAPAPAPNPLFRVGCMEDEPCWNCASMGNHICGAPAAAPLPASQPVALTVTPAPAPVAAQPQLAPVPAPAMDYITAPIIEAPLASATLPAASFSEPQPAAPEVIMEDDIRWDCTTMGNKICGTPTVAPAPAPVELSFATVPNLPIRDCTINSDCRPTTEPLLPETPVACDALKLGDGGTTAQHNCIAPLTDQS